MEHEHISDQHMGTEGPHFHEAPGAPLVDSHVFATIRLLVHGPLSERARRLPASGTDALDCIEQHIKQLDWVIGLSQRLIRGDRTAQPLLSSWLATHVRHFVPNSHTDNEHEALTPSKHMAGHGEGHPGSGGEPPFDGFPDGAQERTLGLNVRAVRELFLGVVYVADPEDPLGAGALDFIETTVGRAIHLLDTLHHYATSGPEGSEHADTLMNLLDQLPGGEELTKYLLGDELLPEIKDFPQVPEINPILECLEILREGTVGLHSGFGVLRQGTTDDLGLTRLITRISPTTVCAGKKVTIYAHPRDRTKQFPASQPKNYGVFLDPCQRQATITKWSSKSVVIEVPEDALTGCIYFGRVSTAQLAAEARLAETQAITGFSDCLGSFGLKSGGGGAIAIDPIALCPLTYCPPGSPTYLKVEHKPDILSFIAEDATGHKIGMNGVEAGTPVQVSWEVRSDAGGPLQINISGTKSCPGSRRG